MRKNEIFGARPGQSYHVHHNKHLRSLLPGGVDASSEIKASVTRWKELERKSAACSCVFTSLRLTFTKISLWSCGNPKCGALRHMHARGGGFFFLPCLMGKPHKKTEKDALLLLLLLPLLLRRGRQRRRRQRRRFCWLTTLCA